MGHDPSERVMKRFLRGCISKHTKSTLSTTYYAALCDIFSSRPLEMNFKGKLSNACPPLLHLFRAKALNLHFMPLPTNAETVGLKY